MKVNKGFLKKIPDNAEAALVLEGKLPGKWLVAGMHGAAFFCFGAGQKEFFQGGAGRRRDKIFRRGRTTVKLGAFSGQGNLENFLGPGQSGAVFFPGARAGRGGHPGWL